METILPSGLHLTIISLILIGIATVVFRHSNMKTLKKTAPPDGIATSLPCDHQTGRGIPFERIPTKRGGCTNEIFFACSKCKEVIPFSDNIKNATPEAIQAIKDNFQASGFKTGLF
ncbi:MAG: hypothetical protein HGA38_04455 [Candidatus Moranbacteria bacterium]|nr:hypothetical protein [Candidatus Moranbacteria bacterium]NTW46471.1 hypothetical protein [Candidatus Moranbacteria bacterium]